MSNNAGPRKVNESRHLPKTVNLLHRTTQSKAKKMSSFEDVLNLFLGSEEDCTQQQATPNAVRQLLASLKTFNVRQQNDMVRLSDS